MSQPEMNADINMIKADINLLNNHIDGLVNKINQSIVLLCEMSNYYYVGKDVSLTNKYNDAYFMLNKIYNCAGDFNNISNILQDGIDVAQGITNDVPSEYKYGGYYSNAAIGAKIYAKHKEQIHERVQQGRERANEEYKKSNPYAVLDDYAPDKYYGSTAGFVKPLSKPKEEMSLVDKYDVQTGIDTSRIYDNKYSAADHQKPIDEKRIYKECFDIENNDIRYEADLSSGTTLIYRNNIPIGYTDQILFDNKSLEGLDTEQQIEKIKNSFKKGSLSDEEYNKFVDDLVEDYQNERFQTGSKEEEMPVPSEEPLDVKAAEPVEEKKVETILPPGAYSYDGRYLNSDGTPKEQAIKTVQYGPEPKETYIESPDKYKENKEIIYDKGTPGVDYRV